MKAILGLLCILATVATAQELAQVGAAAPLPVAGLEQDDPGQAIYKKGYSAILAKKWDEARKQFMTLVRTYPTSKYVDAAEYWTAYSYAQTDQEKAVDLYRHFIEQYSESKYFDDAVADYEKLALRDKGVPALAPLPPLVPKAAAGVPLGVWRPMPSPAPAIAAAPVGSFDKKDIDPAVQLKMDAIHALGSNPEDAQAYETVKAIALDQKQPIELRETALQTVVRFKDHDPVEVLLAVAASGDVRLRTRAIYGIGSSANKGDDRALKALRAYARDGKQLREIREASLVALFRLDEAGMFETLSSIARSDPDRSLRVQAVHMIGRQGQENPAEAFKILKALASDESQDPEVREASVQALSFIKSEESLALLKGIATSSAEKKLRLSAIYAMSRYQEDPPPEVEQTLRAIVSNPREDSEMRLSALYALRTSGGAGLTDFYKSLALNDEDEQIRQASLHVLIQSSSDKAAMLSTFIELFEKAPEGNRSLRETALYGIGSVGNDQAVAYLATVAKSHHDYELRRRAVYYLGSIGGEKAKAALLEILK